ncbi:MAG: hypothetical protein M3O41_12120 [Pseudomonadota bacterium]|nr:hypothetical protein [Pseudomonadota bacterium]
MNSTTMKKIAVVVCGSLATLATARTVTAEELVVIVNASNPTVSVSADQVQQLFLGMTATMPGGVKARPVDQAEESPLRTDFYQKVAGKSAAQIRAIWSRLVFSGRGMPPKILASSADVKKFVAAERDGIGYIEKSAADSSVKVVLTLP